MTKFSGRSCPQLLQIYIYGQLPRWHSGKESACHEGDIRDMGLILGSGRFPTGGTGNPLQYSCLGNPMDRGAGRLQSMGSQRVRHDLVTEHIHIYGHGR